MISIKLADKILKLLPNAKVAFEFNNAAFDDDIIQGDVGLPMTIPYRGNAKALRFNHELLMKNRSVSFTKSVIYYKDVKLFSSICDILSIDRENANISHRINMSSLLAMSRKLKDLNWGETNIGTLQGDILAFANDAITFANPGYGFTFPMIKNTGFYDGKNADFEGYINNYEMSTGLYENVTTNRNTLVPMLFLMEIIRKGFAYDGYTVLDEGFMADPIQQRLMVYNNYAIDKIIDNSSPTNGMKSRCETLPQFDQFSEDTVIYDNDSTDGNYDALGAYDNATGRYTIQAAGLHTIKIRNKFTFTKGAPVGSTDTINIRLYKNATGLKTETITMSQATYVDMYLTYSFVATAGDVGQDLYTTVTYQNSHDTEIKLILQTPYNYFSVNDHYVASTNLNTYDGLVKLANHVPDMTFGQLINTIRKGFNLAFRFNHYAKTVSIQYFDALRVQSIKNLNNRSIVGHTVRLENSIKYKSFKYNWPGDDTLLNENFKPYDNSLYIGEFDSSFVLNTLAPPSDTYAGRFARVLNLNQIWRCDRNGGAHVWKYYTDAWYEEVVFPDGAIEHEVAMAPLMMYQENLGVSLFDYQIFPHIEQKGSSNEFDLGINPSTALRLFYWQGDQSSTFPSFCTSTNYTNGASLVTAAQIDPMSLMWDKSLRPLLWQNRIDMFSHGEWIEKKIQPTLPDLLSLDTNDLVRIDNMNFLIKQARGEIGDIIGEILLTLIKI